MPAALLEINDCGLRLWRSGELRADSPGYAWLRGRRIEFGEAAAGESRRCPGAVENRFWQRMDLSPLARSAPTARHQADLCYLHLERLRRRHGAENDELLVATPGHYSDEQLSLLLGVLQRSRWPLGALVDGATLSAAGGLADGERGLHIELQLHQCVLTRLAASDGQLARQRARAIPATGLLALRRRWAERIASAFLHQQRYDPMHSAAAEQDLYLALAGWAQALPGDGELRLERDGETLRASVPEAAWRDAIAEEAETLARAVAEFGAGEPVLLSSRIASLWALREGLSAALGASGQRLDALQAANAARRAPPPSDGSRSASAPVEFLERVDNAPARP